MSETQKTTTEQEHSRNSLQIPVHFYSYFKDLVGSASTTVTLSQGSTVADLHEHLMQQHPRLAEMRRSTLIAVGVEYRDRQYILQPGDEVSLFPPVQGG